MKKYQQRVQRNNNGPENIITNSIVADI